MMSTVEHALITTVSLNVVDTRLDDAAGRCRPLVASLGAVSLTASRTEVDGPRSGVNLDLTLTPAAPSASGGEAVRQLAAPLLERFRWGRGDLDVVESAAGYPMGFAAGRERTTDGVTPLSVSVGAVGDTAEQWWDPPEWLPADASVLAVRRRVRRLPVAASDDDVVVRVHARLTAPDLDTALVRCLPLLGRADVWSVDLHPVAVDGGGVWGLALLLVLPLVEVSPQAPFGTGVDALAAEFGLLTGRLRRSPLGVWMVAAMEATRPLTDAPTVEALYVRTGIDPFDPGPVDRPVETREMGLRGREKDGPDEAELANAIEEALRDAVRVVLTVDVVGPVADAAAVVRDVVGIDEEDIESISSETLADGRRRIVAHLGATMMSAEEVLRFVVASTELQPWEFSLPESADGLAAAEWQGPSGTSGIVRIELNAGKRLGLS
ncbi:hypothetical protein AB0A95_04010 [Micromonospora sp. NPDC049230]|uniref:hypothetical protein n=1 Tax=Micromonospora sp. NPDC049230 TaxID=3155502 RepID=UPI0033F05850